MRNLEIEKEMYRRAAELIEKRYPIGWGGAGIVHTSNGNYYTSVSIETANASAIVCIETGAMLETHKYNEKVTHCMCLIRNDEKSQYRVLSPCGICQERLRYWGVNQWWRVVRKKYKYNGFNYRSKSELLKGCKISR